MSVCLDDLRYRDTATMDVTPPGGGEPIASITFAGPAHEKTRAQAERLWRASTRISVPVSMRRQTQTLDDVEREAVGQLVERMVDWSGIKRRDEGGEAVEVPFSTEHATEMLINPALGWLFDQCSAFLASNASFLPEPVGTAKREPVGFGERVVEKASTGAPGEAL